MDMTSQSPDLFRPMKSQRRQARAFQEVFRMRVLRSARWLVLALVLSLVPASSFAGVFISVGFAPPVLPVYVQPPCPEPGLMWVPGYWAYGDDGYYWVPGAWVPLSYVGALWTLLLGLRRWRVISFTQAIGDITSATTAASTTASATWASGLRAASGGAMSLRTTLRS